MRNDGPWKATGRLGGRWLPELSRGVRAINEEVLTPIEDLTNLLAEALRLAALILAARQDPASVALNLAIDALDAVLRQLGDTKVGLHTILIPPTTRSTTGEAVTGGLVTLSARAAVVGYGLGPYLRGQDAVADVDDVRRLLAQRITKQFDAQDYESPALAQSDRGGIDPWLDAFEESLRDTQDSHRPNYRLDAGVYAVVILFSAPSIIELTQAIARVSSLWGRAYPVDPTLDILPAPRNLTAKRAGTLHRGAQVEGDLLDLSAKVQGPSLGLGLGYFAGTRETSDTDTLLQIRWDAPVLPAMRVLRFFRDGATIDVLRTRIYASEKPFGPQHHAEGLASLEAFVADAWVPVVHAVLPQSSQCYLCATYDIEIIERDVGPDAVAGPGQRVEFDVDRQVYSRITSAPRAARSNIVYVPRADLHGAVTAPARGTPPDWYTITGGAADLLPPLKTAIQYARDFLDGKRADLTSLYQDAIDEVELLQSAVAYARPRIDAAQELLEAIAAVLESLSRIRVYAAQFSIPSGTDEEPGGTEGLIREVRRSVTETDFHTRFGPSDLVAGGCFVAGGQLGTELAVVAELLLGVGLVDPALRARSRELIDPESYQPSEPGWEQIGQLFEAYADQLAADADTAQTRADELTAQTGMTGLHDVMPGNNC